MNVQASTEFMGFMMNVSVENILWNLSIKLKEVILFFLVFAFNRTA